MFYISVLLSVAISMCTARNVEPRVYRYMKELFPAGRNLNESYSDTVSAASVGECAKKCFVTNCVSFLYKENNGNCDLMDKMHVDYGETPGQDGIMLYDEIGVCDVPTSQVNVPNGRLLFTYGLDEGARAEYECLDTYFPTTSSGLCDASGQWTGLDLGCQLDSDNKYSIPIGGKFQPGVCVNIIATPSSLISVVVLFYEANGNMNFGNEIIFDKDGDVNLVSRNSNFGGTWGTYEKDTPIFPFAVGQEFDIVICTNETHYKVTSGNDELYTFAFRSPLANLDKIDIRGGLVARRVRFIY